MEEQRKTGNKVLENALAVLTAFPKNGTASVTELGETVGLSKGAVSKILATFRSAGFVVQDPETRRFILGPSLIHLGYQALSMLDIRSVARPYLKQLSEKYSENTMLMIAQGDNAIIIEQFESPKTVKVTMKVGELYPLHRGAAPKLLLAHMEPEVIEEILSRISLEPLTPFSITGRETLEKKLEEIRKNGYCLSPGEIDEGAMAIAVPVWDGKGHVVAGIAIAGPKPRMEQSDFDQMLADLKIISEKVSGHFGALGS